VPFGTSDSGFRAEVTPSIIIASRAGLSYNDFLVHLAPLLVVLPVVFIGLCRWLFRSAFTYDPQRAASVMELNESVIALVGGLILLAASRLRAEHVAKDVEWPTLVFYAGLFVMVGAPAHTGVSRTWPPLPPPKAACCWPTPCCCGPQPPCARATTSVNPGRLGHGHRPSARPRSGCPEYR
jgi:Na+/H+ antiporter NhaD/arsenite permease-like protein